MLKTSNIGKMWVVGLGPGEPEYATLKAAKLIEGAGYVVGFKQALQIVEKLVKGKTLIIDYTNEGEVLKLLEPLFGRKTSDLFHEIFDSGFKALIIAETLGISERNGCNRRVWM